MRARSVLLEGAIAALLLFMACVPFADVLRDPLSVPSGIDQLQHYSRESVIRRAFAHGHFPLWNPYEFSGFPIQSDLQAGVFYPPSAALRLLPIASFLTWTVIFHVWLFGAGSYAFCRVWGISRWVSILAGVALMFGGIIFPRVYAGHMDVLRTTAWIPLALALAVRSIDRGSSRPSPALVLVLACQMLGSFLQFSVYTFLCIGAYAAFAAWWPRDGNHSRARTIRLATQMGLLVLLVAGILAFQLLPTARLILASGRAGGLPYGDAKEGAFRIQEFLRFVMPAHRLEDIGREGWETSAYVGMLFAYLAPLAFFDRLRRRSVIFLFIVAGATLVLAFGTPFYLAHWLIFPMFRIPGRAIVFFALPVCLLGAIGLERLIGHRRGDAARPGIAWRIGGLAALAIASLIVVLDTLNYARLFVHPRVMTDRFLQSLPLTLPPGGRVLSLCESHAHALELSALGIPSIDGYNSYFFGDYARYALQARHEDPPRHIPAFPRIGAINTLPDMRLISALNVTHIVSCDPLNDASLRQIDREGPFFIYRNSRAAGRVTTMAGGAAISDLVADRPDGILRFEITSPSPQRLWLAEPFYPERRATVNGEKVEIEKVNIALSSISVPAGQHSVELRYVPAALYAGTGVSLFTLLLWIGTAIWKRGERRLVDAEGFEPSTPRV